MSKIDDSRSEKPLRGRKIAVTRAWKQLNKITALLGESGAEVIEVPTIRIENVDTTPVRRVIEQLDLYDLVIFTSANAVNKFLEHIQDEENNISRLRKMRIAAVGSSTSLALEERGFPPDIVPDEFVAESLVRKINETGFDLKGMKILLPRALEARQVLNLEMEAQGAIVDDIPVYKTVPAEPAKNEQILRQLIEPPDVVTFTSPKTARYFESCLPEEFIARIKECSVAACIGPITAEEANGLGFNVKIVPRDYTIEGLVKGIIEYFSQAESEF